MNLSPEVFMPDRGKVRRVWQPLPGLMLSGAGQCPESIHAMQQMQGSSRKPALIALYESISGGRYHGNPNIVEAHTLFPGAILQIGLQLPLFDRAGLLAIGRGDWDNALVAMANTYQSISQPILLRIGYEFDGVKWNGYDPDAYILAYRRIAAVLEEKSVRNVALVWDSYTTDNENAADWYPGDDVVDWLGYNTLPPKFWGENLIARMAKEKGKPLMNGEASYSECVGDLSLTAWLEGYFTALEKAEAQAFQYINWHWAYYPRCAGWDSWASGRVTRTAETARAYMDALTAHEKCMIFRDERYAQPLYASIACARRLTDGEPPCPWVSACDQVTAQPGFRYDVQGAVACYGTGWQPYWEGTTLRLTLHLDSAVRGICLLNLAHVEPTTLTINGTLYRWEGGHGYLAVPVDGSDIELRLEGSVPLHIADVFLLTTDSAETSDVTLDAGVLRWQPCEGAELYHVYRDGQLWAVTTDCTFPAAHPSRWAVAPWSAHRGLGRITEAKA